MNISAKLNHIDYGKLLTRIQTPDKSKGPLANFFAKTIKVAISPFVIKKLLNSPSILRRLIFSVADDYGITISELSIESKVFSQPCVESDRALNASIIIGSIDYAMLSKVIVESLDSKNTIKRDATLLEVVRIIKPFIGETIATIPPYAIVELFELLVKDKVIESVKKYGIEVSNITLG